VRKDKGTRFWKERGQKLGVKRQEANENSPWRTNFFTPILQDGDRLRFLPEQKKETENSFQAIHKLIQIDSNAFYAVSLDVGFSN